VREARLGEVFPATWRKRHNEYRTYVPAQEKLSCSARLHQQPCTLANPCKAPKAKIGAPIIKL
jgi:hypothetical protein